MKIRNLNIPGDGVLIDAVAFLPDTEPIDTVILCHGLPRGLPEPDDNTDPGYPGLAEQFVDQGYAAVVFNFRGTGKTTGSLEIAKWPADLIAVMDGLDKEDDLKSKAYCVIGFSTGGSSAIVAAAKDKRIDPLIGCAAPANFDFLKIPGNEELFFDHYKNVGMIRPEYTQDAKTWAQNFYELNSLKAMENVKAENVYLLHGAKDNTVPVEHAGLLANALPDRVFLRVIAGSGHQLRKEPAAIATIFSFLNELHLGA